MDFGPSLSKIDLDVAVPGAERRALGIGFRLGRGPPVLCFFCTEAGSKMIGEITARFFFGMRNRGSAGGVASLATVGSFGGPCLGPDGCSI